MAITDNSGRRDQVSWNVGQYHAFYVGSLVQKAFNRFIGGELYDWFWTLNAIREIINHDLKEEEIKELDDSEKEIFKHFRKERILSRPDFKDKVIQYQRKIMKYLKLQGYFPKKEDRTKLSF